MRPRDTTPRSSRGKLRRRAAESPSRPARPCADVSRRPWGGILTPPASSLPVSSWPTPVPRRHHGRGRRGDVGAGTRTDLVKAKGPQRFRPKTPLDLRPASLPFASSTAGCSRTARIIGQARALEAIALGLEMEAPGYNVFLTGFVGTGRNTTIRSVLEQLDRTAALPPDLCYVHNFADSRPPAGALPCRLEKVAVVGKMREGGAPRAPRPAARLQDEPYRKGHERIPGALPEEAARDPSAPSRRRSPRKASPWCRSRWARRPAPDRAAGGRRAALPAGPRGGGGREVRREAPGRDSPQAPRPSKTAGGRARRAVQIETELRSRISAHDVASRAAHREPVRHGGARSDEGAARGHQWLDARGGARPGPSRGIHARGWAGPTGTAAPTRWRSTPREPDRRQRGDEGAPGDRGEHAEPGAALRPIERTWAARGERAIDHTRIKAGSLHRANSGYLVPERLGSLLEPPSCGTR